VIVFLRFSELLVPFGFSLPVSYSLLFFFFLTLMLYCCNPTLPAPAPAPAPGRIHAAQMRFGNSYMVLSITVVPSNDMDFLFGLDNLRRLRGVIDLSRNVLCLDGAAGREEVGFLGYVLFFTPSHLHTFIPLHQVLCEVLHCTALHCSVLCVFFCCAVLFFVARCAPCF
jgi:hypothetical protein